VDGKRPRHLEQVRGWEPPAAWQEPGGQREDADWQPPAAGDLDESFDPVYRGDSYDDTLWRPSESFESPGFDSQDPSYDDASTGDDVDESVADEPWSPAASRQAYDGWFPADDQETDSPWQPPAWERRDDDSRRNGSAYERSAYEAADYQTAYDDSPYSMRGSEYDATYEIAEHGSEPEHQSTPDYAAATYDISAFTPPGYDWRSHRRSYDHASQQPSYDDSHHAAADEPSYDTPPDGVAKDGQLTPGRRARDPQAGNRQSPAPTGYAQEMVPAASGVALRPTFRDLVAGYEPNRFAPGFRARRYRPGEEPDPLDPYDPESGEQAGSPAAPYEPYDFSDEERSLYYSYPTGSPYGEHDRAGRNATYSYHHDPEPHRDHAESRSKHRWARQVVVLLPLALASGSWATLGSDGGRLPWFPEGPRISADSNTSKTVPEDEPYPDEPDVKVTASPKPTGEASTPAERTKDAASDRGDDRRSDALPSRSGSGSDEGGSGQAPAPAPKPTPSRTQEPSPKPKPSPPEESEPTPTPTPTPEPPGIELPRIPLLPLPTRIPLPPLLLGSSGGLLGAAVSPASAPLLAGAEPAASDGSTGGLSLTALESLSGAILTSDDV